jgi:hypothetical protein
VSTKSVLRKIGAEDLRFPGFLRAPREAKYTAFSLWTFTDPLGRREMVPELIAADIFPGEAATDLVLTHLLMLSECGFLDLYEDEGREWIALRHPLRVDARVAFSDCPPPPVRERSRTFAAMGGGRERAEVRARERVRAEQEASASLWAEWAERIEQPPAPPERPLLLNAPPIGCPDHPHGAFKDCGPCGTARRRHDRWVAEARYGRQVTDYEEAIGDDDDDDTPF